MVSAFVSWHQLRRQTTREKSNDHFISFEKQIDSAEKRGDADQVERLRLQYEREQEGWRNQQNLEFAAPRHVSKDGPKLSEAELEDLVNLIHQASNAPPATLSPHSHVLRGNVYFEMGEFDNAIMEYSVSIKLNPTFVDAYQFRGISYGIKGKYDKAIADFNEAIRINPGDALAYYNKGLAYSDTQVNDKAIADFSKAIELKPKFLQAHNNRGVAYLRKGEHERAIADFTEAISIDSDDAFAYDNLGGVFAAKGEYDKALENVDKSISLSPNDPGPHFNRGIATWHLGNKIEANRSFKMALELGYDPAKVERALSMVNG